MTYFHRIARFEESIRPDGPEEFISEFVEALSGLLNRFAARSYQMDGWQDTATTSAYELSGIARQQAQKDYETWRDSSDDDGHEMQRQFHELGVKPIRREATEEF